MLKRHYNSREITNSGESRVNGFLSDLIYDDLNWHGLHGLLLTSNYANRTGRGEIDFILICEYGVLVLEVKGGRIAYTGGRILQKDIEGEAERTIDPFGQVRNNVDTIQRFLQKRLGRNIFVGEAVVFPQSTFHYQGEAFRNFWHTGSQQAFGLFLKQTLKAQADAFGAERLKSKELQEVAAALIPEVDWKQRDKKLANAKEETEKRSELNHRILRGLSGNKRLLIEGPPGSGKSTFAQAFILDKVEREDCRVLYLCWNELLAVHTRHFFRQKGVDGKVTAIAYFDYVNLLFAHHPVTPRVLGFDDVPALHEHVALIVSDLQSVNALPQYDLIVIDEAQDLFHKGIEEILDKQLNGGKNGLAMGRYMVFFDSLQAFDREANADLYDLVYQLIQQSAACYKLYDYFRTIEGSGIANFLDDAMGGTIDFNGRYGVDMDIKIYRNEGELLPLLKSVIRTAVHSEKVKPNDMVVLFSSNLISGAAAAGGKPLDQPLLMDEGFEKIEKEILNQPSAKCKYTTALRYKGLEKDLVVLVVKDLFDERIKTFYQLYIGASRAKAKVVLLIDEDSVRRAKKQAPALEGMLVKEPLTG